MIQSMKLHVNDRALGLGGLAIDRIDGNVCLVGKNGVGKSRLLKLVKEGAESRNDLPHISLAFIGDSSDRKRKVCYEIANAFHHSFSDKSNALSSSILNDADYERVDREYDDYDFESMQSIAWRILAYGAKNNGDDDSEYQKTVRNIARLFNERYSEEVSVKMTIGETKGRYENKPFVLINGHGLGSHGLSTGQFVGVSFLVAILVEELNVRREKHSLNGRLVIFDEPELSLHPSLAGTVVREIRKLVGESGQLWVATHSPFVMNEFDPDEIYPMHRDSEGNTVVAKPGSKAFGDSIREIVDSDSFDRFLERVNNSVDESISSFLLQCTRAPTTVAFRAGDPQTESLARHVLSGESVTIVDIGSGNMRLKDALIVAASDLVEGISIDYIAMDPKYSEAGIDRQTHSSCEISISRICEHVVNEKAKFCFIVNVLHELHPRELQETFAKVKKCYANASLVVAEHTRMRKGENAHEYLYTLFEQHALDTLFGTNGRLLKSDRDELLAIEYQISDINVTDERVLAAALIQHEALVQRLRISEPEYESIKSDSKKMRDRVRDMLSLGSFRLLIEDLTIR